MFLTYFILILSLFQISSQDDHIFRKLPSFLKICRRSDANLNNCVKESIDILRPFLVKGIPEFGIPACEPFLVPEIVINQGSGSVLIQSTYKNVHVTGATQFLIRDLNIDMDKLRIELSIWLPFLHMISDYDLEGKILLFPIYGSGVCQGNYTDIDAKILIQGKKFLEKGQTFYHIDNFKVAMAVGNATVHLGDLYQGNSSLGDAMNSFINDNADAIVEDIKPVLQETLGDMFKLYGNNIFHKYPLKVLLPD